MIDTIVIDTKIEVSQHCALPPHSSKTLCPGCSDIIAAEIQVGQRWAQPQDSCKPL